jgi:mRNA interferase MazF
MAKFSRGDIVILPFPFSDATGAKLRPSLVLAELPFLGGMDYLVCMISSNKTSDPHSLEILPSDLTKGRLAVQSYLRPLYLFGTEGNVIVRRIGVVNPALLSRVVKAIVSVVDL